MTITTHHDAADRIQTVTSKTFDALVRNGLGPIAVEFMSYGCGYCRAIEPALQEVAKLVKSKETIFRLNVAVAQELADSYDVQSTPTFIMFQNGGEVGRVEGPAPTVSAVLAAVTQAFES